MRFVFKQLREPERLRLLQEIQVSWYSDHVVTQVLWWRPRQELNLRT